MLTFRPIQIEDQIIIDKFIAKCPTHQSDYSLATLILWTELDDIKICVTEKALYLTGCIDESFACFSPLCDISYYSEAFNELREYCKSIDKILAVWYCTRPQIAALLESGGFSQDERDGFLKRPRFKTKELCVKNDRNQAEYCYYPDNLINLEGKKYHNKKNRLSLFHRTYDGRYEIRSMTDEDCEGISRLIIDWNKMRGYDYHDELNRLKTIIDNRAVLGVEFHLLIIDGNIAGMTMFQKLKNNVGVVSFEKCNSEHLQGFSVLNWYEACVLKDCVVVNRQEDMGIEGLRRAKMSFNPDEMVEKFKVTENLESQIIPMYQRLFGDSDSLMSEVFSADCKVSYTALEMHKGKVVAFGFARQKSARVYTAVFDLPFIFGVGTDENYRRQGRAAGVMTKLMRALYYDNNPIAMLKPADEGLYEMYGKLGFVTFNYICEVPLLPLIREGTVLEQAEEGAAGEITDIFNRAAGKYNLTQYRTEKDSAARIKEVLLDGGNLVLLIENQTPYGYMFIDENKRIDEFIALPTPIKPVILQECKNSINEQLNNLGIGYVLSADSVVTVPVQCVKGEKGVMARVINPEVLMQKLLPHLNCDKAVNVNFTIDDPYIRDSRFNLKIEGGRAAISYDVDAAADNIIMSPDSMLKWLLGGESAQGLPSLLDNPSTAFYDEW